jgi:myo-inositol-1(or 4)-monophosphatase
MSYKKELVVAKAAAKKAGRYLMQVFNAPKNNHASFKKHHEIVTLADVRADEIIAKILKTNFRGDEILSEEIASKTKTSAGRLWVVDPLDGTNNFAHNVPIFAVCIALSESGNIKAGVIYLPIEKKMFWAADGQGAYCNGKKINVSETKKIKDSFLLQCHGYEKAHKKMDNKILGPVKLASSSTRKLGAAGFELASVADGSVDGGYIIGTRPWDSAAGAILVREAGGAATNFAGCNWTLKDGNILFSNKNLHQQLLKIIA